MGDLVSYVTSQSEYSNLLESDKFKIMSVLTFALADGETINDGSTEASTYIKSAVDYAVTNGIGKIFFPYGTYLCSSPIFDSKVIPEGIEFIASGRFGGLDSAEGTIIKYTGASTCFNFQESLGTNQVGGISFDGFCFQCTNVAGTMFAFNDVTATPTDDATTQNYIRNVKFTRCSFRGEGTASVTGNAIQGLKVFELLIDETCQFSGWKRAIYLKGCDNNTISGRYSANGRHIMLEQSSTFGNGNRIDARFIGSITANGVGLAETAYALHISAPQTTIYSPFIEGNCGAGASIYVNSECISIYSPYFASIGTNWLEVGAAAADINIYSPETTGTSTKTIVYATPTYWNWSGSNQSYRVNIYNPSTRFERWLTPHPRLKIISPYSNIENFNKGNSIVDIYGEGIQRYTLSAFNLERATNIGGYTGFISGINSDTSAFNGYSLAIPATTGSLVLSLTVGKDIQPNQVVNMIIRYKNEDTPGSGTFRWVYQLNGTGVSNGAIAVSTDYTIHSEIITTATLVYGDVVTFGVYNTSDKAARVSAITLETTPTSNIKLGSAAPTADYHFNGEIVRNYAPTTAKNIEYWRCITSGTPGTWKAYGAGRGTTGERPALATGDDGYCFYDTTVNKVIMWNGSAWLA